MKGKKAVKARLDEFKFSPDKDYSKEDYLAMIAVLLYEGADVFVLREALGDKLMEIQQEIITQNVMDVMSGKYKDEADMEKRMPLFKKEYPDGSAQLLNVPEEFMQWAGFIGTLNDEYFPEI